MKYIVTVYHPDGLGVALFELTETRAEALETVREMEDFHGVTLTYTVERVDE